MSQKPDSQSQDAQQARSEPAVPQRPPAPGARRPEPMTFPFSRSPEEDEIREMYGWGV